MIAVDNPPAPAVQQPSRAVGTLAATSAKPEAPTTQTTTAHPRKRVRAQASKASNGMRKDKTATAKTISSAVADAVVQATVNVDTKVCGTVCKAIHHK